MVKNLNNTNTGGCMTKDVKYEYIDTQDLKWLNKRAIAKNKNHYLPDNILNYLVWNYKAVIVKFRFLHNEKEWRLVLYGGDKYETLTLDVDFIHMDKVQKGVLKKQKEAA